MDIKKIDETIESICDWIRKNCQSEKNMEHEISDMVFALAEVINARANVVTYTNS